MQLVWRVLSCGHNRTVCEVVSVPSVSVVIVVTVIRVLLFVLRVSILRVCEGDDSAGVGDEGGLVVVSAWHEYGVLHVVQVLCLAQLTC